MIPLGVATKQWREHEFYADGLVVGLDIGIAGIGVCVRKGGEIVWARTYLFTLPVSAPMKERRLKRSARRSRKSRKHREFLLKQFCERHGLPWTVVNSDPFKLRLRAINGKLASLHALVVCLRHIIKHRGYDYHLLSEGDYPWGDELDLPKAVKWAASSCCNPELGAKLRYEMANAGFTDEKLAKFRDELNDAEERYAAEPIRTMLEEHFAEKSHVRPAARGHNFPRELVRDHLKEICERHAAYFGGDAKLKKAFKELLAILDYRRKEPGALAERRVKRCPYAPHLLERKIIKCSPNSELAIRRFKLLEFLSTRSFVAADGERLLVTGAMYEWLDGIIQEDAQAVEKRQPRPATRTLRSDFAKRAEVKLAPNNASHNKDYFDQLKDLLVPRLSVLKGRASMCSDSAVCLLEMGLKDGFEPELVKANLSGYYRWRRDVQRGSGLYPQVEFLLGRRSKDGSRQVVPGILHRILEHPDVQAKTGGQVTPDYVVIECGGDIPRNQLEKMDVQKEQKQRRAFKDALFAEHGLGEVATTDADRKRVLLFDQQSGLCPYTGASLDSPLNPDLQIDHIYPRERGGISELVNLVLTHSKTNNRKGKQTPWEARADFPNAFALLKRMKWNKAKRELFARREGECPLWQNLTRVAQLARNLREEVAHWMGIKGDATTMAQRIGTPSGFLTYVCRESWKAKLPEKDRNNHRHHLWDAVVISHIPPGRGLNHFMHGGIFYQQKATMSGHVFWLALKLGPDLISFEKKTANMCLVVKPRARKSKKKRVKESIYGLAPDGKLKVRKPLIKDGEIQAKAEKWIEQAAIPEKPRQLLPRKKLDKWLSQEEIKTLTLANKTRVESVPVIVGEESPVSMVPHRNDKGEIIGYKVSTETYLRYEIWKEPGEDKNGNPIHARRLIPHPRGLKFLRQRGISWGKRSGEEESLRNQICGTLKPYSKKVGTIRKGDLLYLPLDSNGDITFDSDKEHCRLWYRVAALKTSGQITMSLVEYKDKSATPLASCKKNILQQKPSSPDVLVGLLKFTAEHGQKP